MEFIITKTSDRDYISNLTIETIDELIAFIDKNNKRIVIGEEQIGSFDDKQHYIFTGTGKYIIEIYDDWR